MKKKTAIHERRGRLLSTTQASERILKRLYRRMLDIATLRGESALLRTVFSA